MTRTQKKQYLHPKAPSISYFLTKSKEKENHSGFWTKREDQKFNMFKKCRHPCLNANMPKTSDENLRFHCLQYFFNSWSNIILTDLFPGAIWHILRLCLELFQSHENPVSASAVFANPESFCDKFIIG